MGRPCLVSNLDAGREVVNPPEGASIDTNGVITWTPNEDQSPRTYSLTTIVRDSNPAAVNAQQLSAMNSFTVFVNETRPLFNLATAAYQSVFPWQDRERERAGTPSAKVDQPPYHLGRCIAWDFEGPVVAKVYPQFAGWQPLKRAQKA